MSIINGWYNADRAFNRLKHINYETGEIEGEVNFAVIGGNRTAGKTVGWGIKMIERIKLGETFMLLARYKDDIDQGYLQKWWEGKIAPVNDKKCIIQDFIKNNKIEFTPKYMKVNGKIAIYTEPISASLKVKNFGGPYFKCMNILIDEAAQKGEHELKIQGRNALSRIAEIRDTVARGYDNAAELCNVIFIMNIAERDNWVYNYLEINPFIKDDTKFTVQDGVCVEIVNNENVKEEYDKTPFGQKIKKLKALQEYYDAGYNNEYQDNTAFIKPRGLIFKDLKIQIFINDKTLGIFRTEEGLHAAEIKPVEQTKTIVNNAQDFTEERVLSDGSWEDILRQFYKVGKLTFDKLQTKTNILEFICCRI